VNRRTLCVLAVLLALAGCGKTPDLYGDDAKAKASAEAALKGEAGQALVADGYSAAQVLARDDQHYEFHRGSCSSDEQCRKAYLVYTDPGGQLVLIVADAGQYECGIPTPSDGKTNLQDYAKLTDELKRQVLQAPWNSRDPVNPDNPNVRVDGQIVTCHQGVLTP
jgi:hypothetical protein